MSAIAQGILTNSQYGFELLPSTAYYGTFGSFIYIASTSPNMGLPFAINTTIRQIGFVTTVGYDSPSDSISMTLRNITSGGTANVTFTEWATDTLVSQALATPLVVNQGDAVLVIFNLTSATLTTVNINQVLATYDLVTTP
jgi:hypothetical protein